MFGMLPGSVKADEDYDAWLPKFSVDYRLTPHLMPYASVARGYTSGGFNTLSSVVAGASYDPEYSWSYEGGIKSAWLDKRLIFNLTAFYIDWQDQQVLQQLGPASFVDCSLQKVVSRTARWDAYATHPVKGFFIMLGILIFTLVVTMGISAPIAMCVVAKGMYATEAWASGLMPASVPLAGRFCPWSCAWRRLCLMYAASDDGLFSFFCHYRRCGLHGQSRLYYGSFPDQNGIAWEVFHAPVMLLDLQCRWSMWLPHCRYPPGPSDYNTRNAHCSLCSADRLMCIYCRNIFQPGASGPGGNRPGTVQFYHTKLEWHTASQDYV